MSKIVAIFPNVAQRPTPAINFDIIFPISDEFELNFAWISKSVNDMFLLNCAKFTPSLFYTGASEKFFYVHSC